MQIRETHLNFRGLSERDDTTAIIIHNSNGGKDVDFSAEQIHNMHIDCGYSGIGYHYVIRKDGTIERGRPEWAVGAHAQGHNYYSIGICLSGDFQIAQPTDEQIDSLVDLIADIAHGYNIDISRATVLGHRDVNDTDCPGSYLYHSLDDIISRAAEQ